MPSSSATANLRLGTAPIQLRTTSYEQASAWLTAILLLMGAVTLLMFLVWISSTIVWDRPPPTVKLDPGGGGSPPSSVLPVDFDEPAASEAPELAKPKTESSLELVSELVVAELAALEALSTEGAGIRGKDGRKSGNNKGPDEGDGTGDEIALPDGRWEIRVSAADLDQYRAYLDYFGIELGVAGGGRPNIDYVRNLTAAAPTVRVGTAQDERRFYFIYRDGPLKVADRTLAAEAGIPVEGRVIIQFMTPETYSTLVRLEHESRGERSIAELIRTVFGVRKVGDKFEYYVLEQDYRTGG